MAQNNLELNVNKLSVQFGGLKALSELSLKASHGELVGIIGPNGAGKTTAFNALTGMCKTSNGQIIYNNVNLTNKPSYFISRNGVARTFQNILLFKSLSVLDNLRIAYHQNITYSMIGGILRNKTYVQQEKDTLKRAFEVLELVNLEEHNGENAANLSYGNQRKLEIARALVTKPKLLLLDEPAAGMNPFETNELVTLIRKLQKELDITILLIEHDMNLVMNLCERIYVLDYGVLIAQGSVNEVRSNPRVIEAYLGEDSPWQS